MRRKEAKFRSEDGKKTLTVKVQLLSELANEPTQADPDVQAYQEESSEEFIIDNGTKRLTITIAE